MHSRSKCGKLWTWWWQQWKGHKEVPMGTAMAREYTYTAYVFFRLSYFLRMGKCSAGCGPGWTRNMPKSQCSSTEDVQAQPAHAFARHWFKTAIEIPANICWQQLGQKYKGRNSLAIKSSFSALLAGDSGAQFPFTEPQGAGCAALLLPRSSLIIFSCHLVSKPPSSSTVQSHKPKGPQERENSGNSWKFHCWGKQCVPRSDKVIQ